MGVVTGKLVPARSYKEPKTLRHIAIRTIMAWAE